MPTIFLLLWSPWNCRHVFSSQWCWHGHHIVTGNGYIGLLYLGQDILSHTLYLVCLMAQNDSTIKKTALESAMRSLLGHVWKHWWLHYLWVGYRVLVAHVWVSDELQCHFSVVIIAVRLVMSLFKAAIRGNLYMFKV